MISDWPFDFVLIDGNSEEEIEENKFKYAVNKKSRHERLREFVGLDNLNLLRIVVRAADLVRGPTGRKPSPEKAQEWLEENVKWGLFHCPDAKTVKRHMENWDAIKVCVQSVNLIEAAGNRWGRDNLLDYPTKVQMIVQKTNATSLGYVVEYLYTQMWRSGVKDPYSSTQLGDAISEILWRKTYITALVRKYPEVLHPRCNSDGSTTAEACTAVMSYLESPPQVIHVDGGA